MTAGSGPTLPVPLGFFDPDTRSLRTSRTTFESASTLSSATLPTSGSMLSGMLYARTRSAPLISGDASSSLPLLKTPTAQLAINGGSQHPDKRREGGHGPTLADEVEHLLPTPTAADSDRTSETYSRGNPTLRGALLPTPTATDAKASSGANPAWGHGVTLTDAARSVGGDTPLPSRAGKRSRVDVPPGQLTIEAD